MQHDNNWWRRRWRRDLKRLEPVVGRLVESKHIYLEVAEIVKNNPKVNKPSSYHVWTIRNYAESSAVAVRTLLSGNRESVSLYRMVHEMSQHAKSLTRRSFLHGWDKKIKYAGEELFDEIAGEDATHVPKHVFDKDLKKLERLRLEITRFVNRRIAHLERKKFPYAIPTFDQLHGTISQIDELYCSYKLLLTGSRPETLLPTWLYDWEDILRVPWIEE